MAVCCQDEGKRYHRYCSHSGGSGLLKVERNCSRKSEDEGSNSAHCREQQQYLETKAVVIQRAWRASQSRRESWPDQNQTQTGLYQEQEPPGTPGTLKTPVMSSEDYSLTGGQTDARTDRPNDDRKEGETREGLFTSPVVRDRPGVKAVALAGAVPRCGING
ncbi:unnamed protein product [Arctogadus glacialis]